MKSNDATITTACDSTDSTATSAYEGSKPVTDCKRRSDCCRCNDKGSCWRCRCVKAGNICTNCLPLQHNNCMTNKHITNASLMSNSTTIKNESTNILLNLLANSTPPQANQITQSAASPAFTLSQKPVFDFKPVSDCCWCVTTRVAVDAAYLWRLETLALIVYCYGVATVWITNVVEYISHDITTTIKSETSNVTPNQLATSTPPNTS